MRASVRGEKEPGYPLFCACANLRPRKNNEYTQITLLGVELLCVTYYVLTSWQTWNAIIWLLPMCDGYA